MKLDMDTHERGLVGGKAGYANEVKEKKKASVRIWRTRYSRQKREREFCHIVTRDGLHSHGYTYMYVKKGMVEKVSS